MGISIYFCNIPFYISFINIKYIIQISTYLHILIIDNHSLKFLIKHSTSITYPNTDFNFSSCWKLTKINLIKKLLYLYEPMQYAEVDIVIRYV